MEGCLASWVDLEPKMGFALTKPLYERNLTGSKSIMTPTRGTSVDRSSEFRRVSL